MKITLKAGLCMVIHVYTLRAAYENNIMHTEAGLCMEIYTLMAAYVHSHACSLLENPKTICRDTSRRIHTEAEGWVAHEDCRHTEDY